MTNNGEKYPLEIINAGMYRGATASLSLALKELGFGPTWHIITNSEKLMNAGQEWWLENNIFEKLYKGENVNFDEWLQAIQCKTVMDTPVVYFWDKIFSQYPNSKVIISVRDFQKWSKSYTNLLSKLTGPAMELCKKTDPYTKALMEYWDKNHIGNEYNGIAEFMCLPKSKRQTILKNDYYDKYIQKAKHIVPKEQLLIHNVDDGWQPLCKFLAVPVPNKPYPTSNNTKELNKFVYNWKKDRILAYINVYYVVSVLLGLIGFFLYFY